MGSFVVAVWRPDDTLIAFTTDSPSNADMTRIEPNPELERQLADAHTRIGVRPAVLRKYTLTTPLLDRFRPVSGVFGP